MGFALSDPRSTVLPMVIDCDGCALRDLACHDCVVTVLLGMPSVHADAEPAPDRTPLEVTPGEQAALAVLSDHGMVPPLRLVPVSRPAAAPDRPVHRAV